MYFDISPVSFVFSILKHLYMGFWVGPKFRYKFGILGKCLLAMILASFMCNSVTSFNAQII